MTGGQRTIPPAGAVRSFVGTSAAEICTPVALIPFAHAVPGVGRQANTGSTYTFRTRKGGNIRRKFFGSWVVDYRSPSDYEFRIDGKELQSRAGTTGWTKIDSIEFPRERNDIYVRIDVQSGRSLSISGGRFGLMKDTEIADLRHIN